ncbi:DNA translocase FtsK 4TM domain-containing protein, partial [Bordetella sp. 02P26C-1]|uniref:DNA translocase FtsK 4TM domain-containing protein n=1 Tax=Bordetella sp. 02P26C-1 TaxID=2683195 RepID=UPI001352B26E
MPRISTASPRASRNTRNGPSPLQTRISGLLREARWILFAALAAWLTLVLATWSPSDPGWSHSVTNEAIHNRGGMFGAYLSDILLYLFGFSAWWWVVLLLQRVRAGYRRLASHLRASTNKPDEVLPRVRWEEGIGFFLVLIGSLGIEALRLYSWGMHLPGGTDGASGAGGVIGQMLATNLSQAVGFTGATLALLVMLAIGLSLFFSFSWLHVAERVGIWVEGVGRRIRDTYSARQDRKV